MRLLADLLGCFAAVGTMAGWWLRRARQERLSHKEYVKQLQEENRELDEERERISKGEL